MALINQKLYSTVARYFSAGLSCVPIATDGSKRPVVAWKEFQARPMTADERKAHFSNGNFVALVCGEVSGNLLCLDFDAPGLLSQYETVCRDHGFAELIESIPAVQTPSGGNHLWFRLPTAPSGNRKLARDAQGNVLIETRGEAGYAIAPPTPDYALLRGDLCEIPTITAAEWQALESFALLFDEYHAEMPLCDTEKRETGEHGLRPGDEFNERGDVMHYLLKAGWHQVCRRGENIGLRRPGKNGHGISATYHQSKRVFYVFSTNALPFDANRPGEGYSPFAVYSLLEHGGNFSAAAAQLDKEGYGAKIETKRGRLRLRLPENEEPSEEEAEPDKWTDFDLGVAWANHAQGSFIYVEGDQWKEFQGNRWQYASIERVTAAVQTFLETLIGKPAPVRTRNAMFVGKSRLGPVQPDVFNAHPNWIPLRNGVYDVLSGEMMQHAPAHLLTYQLPYDYEARADCPRWKTFLAECLIQEDGAPCSDWQLFLQEWIGYLLIPDNTAQVSTFWLGEGQNGKGVTTRIIECLVGTENTAPIAIEQLHEPYFRAEMDGKLVGIVNEPERRAMQKNGTWFKLITGGNDPIPARRPTEKVFSFKSVCRLIVTCNEMPATDDPSRAYFRRILPIQWRYNVPEDRKDPDLDTKLKAELPGIFNWAMEGLSRFRSRGRFIMPEESKRLLEGYRLDQDHILRFFTEECVFELDASVESADLYRAYRTWCEQNGVRVESSTAFGRRLNKRGCATKPVREKDRVVRKWTGVRFFSEQDILEPDDGDFDDGDFSP